MFKKNLIFFVCMSELNEMNAQRGTGVHLFVDMFLSKTSESISIYIPQNQLLVICIYIYIYICDKIRSHSSSESLTSNAFLRAVEYSHSD
jgi:hypothetical protein